MFPAKCTDRQVKEDAFNDSLKHSGFNPINYPVFFSFASRGLSLPIGTVSRWKNAHYKQFFDQRTHSESPIYLTTRKT